MSYTEKVLDHYENPRNVGTLDKDDPNVGTGLVGAPACGDVMRLQVKIREEYKVKTGQGNEYTLPSELELTVGDQLRRWQQSEVEYLTEVSESYGIITDAKFKTFGCGSAIASSSLVTEWIRGKSVEYAGSIKNQQIVQELSLPPIKVHCSVLAEDAVKSAIADWRKKREEKKKETKREGAYQV